MTVRQLAEQQSCSYVTAAKIAEHLRKRHLIYLHGQTQFISTGRCAKGSALEQRLEKQRKPCLGVIVNAIDNQYYSKMTDCLCRAANDKGYNLIAMINTKEAIPQQEQMDLLLNMGVAGVFVFPNSFMKDPRLFNYFPLPIVMLGRLTNQCTRSTVTVDNFNVGKMAAKHLLDSGYENFLYIGPNQTIQMVDQRRTGFIHGLGRAGVTLIPENKIELKGIDPDRDAAQIMARLSSLSGTVGVFCYHDLIALSLLKSCLTANYRVPQDVGIIGCDDLPISEVCSPSLSTVHYPINRICRTAMEIMLDELNFQAKSTQCIKLHPQLITRESTKK